MNKKQIIVIGEKSINFEEFQNEIEICREQIRETKLNEINLFPEKTFTFIALLWAALLEKLNINFISEKSQGMIINNKKSKINKIKQHKYFRFAESDHSYISFGDEKINYSQLMGNFETFLEKKIFKETDVFFIENECNNLYILCLTFIFPFILKSTVIFDDEVSNVFKKHKPTVFIGNRKEIKKLHNGILSMIADKRILENIYYLFKNWDNGIFSVCINRFFIFNSYRSLRIIIAEDYKDLKGLWIDFESLGIELYTKKNTMEKAEDIKQG